MFSLITNLVFWFLNGISVGATNDGAEIWVAVIALLGSLAAAVVVFVGYLFKRSYDNRSLILQTETEERLRLDTAIKAVELFKRATGTASPAEAAGALFALTHLNQTDFSVRLLENLWPQDLVDSPSAVWVIDSALRSTNPNVVELAATVLRANASKLTNGIGGKWWPSGYEIIWPSNLPFSARRSLLLCRIETLLSEDFEYWQREEINGEIVAIANCLKKEPSPIIYESAAAFLAKILICRDPRQDIDLHSPTGDISLEKLRDDIRTMYGGSPPGRSYRDKELVEALRAWVVPAPFFSANESGPND